MVISSFISSVLVLALGIWAYLRLESSMNLFAEKQLLIEPSRFSFRMWKDMPVTMYQSFTFFNLTNWNQVKAIGQKPRFVEVGPYVYKTIWSKSDINFLDEDKLVSFSEKKQWHFQAHLSRGYEDDLIWTINTPLMTALALIQNAPVITRNIVSVILDGLGEGAFIKRPIRSLLFEGYSDLIVSVGPLFDRRFANFNGKFAYLYNKNDTVDGHWTVATGSEDLSSLNKITRFQSSIVNMTSFSSGQMPQGLNEVKAECAPAWSLDQSTNGQLFAPFNRDIEQLKLQRQLQQIKTRTANKQQEEQQQQQQQLRSTNSSVQNLATMGSRPSESIVQAPKRFFSRISSSVAASQSAAQNKDQNDPHFHHHPSQMYNHHHHHHHHQAQQHQQHQQQQPSASQFPQNVQEKLQQLRDFGKYIFYPDLCRPIHLLPSKQQVTSDNGIQASRYFIDPRVFMNSSQISTNKCYEMNPRPPLANALAATINSVTGANVNVPNLVSSASSPFALFIPPSNYHQHNNHHGNNHLLHNNHHEGGIFERANHPNSFINNALHTLSASANQAADQLASSSNNSPISRLGRVRQLFSNIVSQRMSANPLLPSLAAGPAGLLIGGGGNHHNANHPHFPGAGSLLTARNAPADQGGVTTQNGLLNRQASNSMPLVAQDVAAGSLAPIGGNNLDNLSSGAQAIDAGLGQGTTQPPLMGPPGPGLPPIAAPAPVGPLGGSDRWITQFRFKWPRGVFSIGQCQLGAPIYVSLPHFLDADEYYLEQVDGLRPNRSLHEFYIDVESTLHSVPVNAKARLQLNVATPELRFRNIPNAMIPVLWQEVTFKIDKPIATMLYWSFTMSGTIYRIISIVLIASGLGLLVYSFLGGFRSRNRQRRIRRSEVGPLECNRSSRSSGDTSHICPDLVDQRDRVSCASGSHHSDTTTSGGVCGSSSSPHLIHSHRGKSALDRHEEEGRRSSWQHIIINGGGSPKSCAIHSRTNHHNESSATGKLGTFQRNHCNHHLTLDSLDEIRHGASLNRAYATSCNEIHLDRHSPHGGSGPVSSSESVTTNQNSLSPKQPHWSRASSHCELVSSLSTAATTTSKGAEQNCTGCLFACLRNSPQQHGRQQHHQIGGGRQRNGNDFLVATGTTASDISNQVVIQHQQQKQQLQEQQQQQHQQTTAMTTSDIDKATLSSSGSSNLDSCSSIYTMTTTKKSKKFKL